MKSVVQYVLAHGRDLVATTQLAQSKIDLCECVPGLGWTSLRLASSGRY